MDGASERGLNASIALEATFCEVTTAFSIEAERRRIIQSRFFVPSGPRAFPGALAVKFYYCFRLYYSTFSILLFRTVSLFLKVHCIPRGRLYIDFTGPIL